ncbi:hypothetical protein [Marinicella rhabdoformis]|uniref:hypothetical protein n=1 Tax=Marinicella rhabdoformis TaxID=2580566 RepID=UPI0012AEB2BA|nr:hypothetical protein [Marinicella rhabdoformis]
MKYLIIISFLTTVAFNASANDAPCEVNLYKSQGQFNKAVQQPGDKDLNRIISQRNLTLPEVMAKADRFKIVKNVPEEQVVVHDENEVVEGTEEDTPDMGSKLGGMFQLLIPAKLRNPAR